MEGIVAAQVVIEVLLTHHLDGRNYDQGACCVCGSVLPVVGGEVQIAGHVSDAIVSALEAAGFIRNEQGVCGGCSQRITDPADVRAGQHIVVGEPSYSLEFTIDQDDVGVPTRVPDDPRRPCGPVLPLWMHPDAIKEQRSKGWTEFHPEDYCHACGQRNVRSWHTDGDEWNRVDPTTVTILCPQCFTERWTAVTGIRATWALVLTESGDLRRAGWWSPEARDELTGLLREVAAYSKHRNCCRVYRTADETCNCGYDEVIAKLEAAGV